MLPTFWKASLGAVVLLSLVQVAHLWSPAGPAGLLHTARGRGLCGRPHALRQARCPQWASVRMLLQGGGGGVGGLKETKYTARFDEMVARIRNYSEVERAALRDKQMRAVLAGIIDGVQDRQVYEAFRILYEDFGPIRFAGDAVFKLVDSMVRSEGIKLRETIEKRGTKVNEGAIAKSREIFELADKDQSGCLDRGEVTELLNGLLEVGFQGPQEIDAFMDKIDYDKDGRVHFDELASGIGDLFVLAQDEQNCYFSKLSSVWGGQGGGSVVADSKYVERYMAMLKSIQEWEEILEHDKSLSKQEGRMQAVLRGCIAGSHRPAVVEALKIVYCEFAPPLRMAGDLIFKLMSMLMSKKGA